MYRKIIFLLVIFLLGGLVGYFTKDYFVSLFSSSDGTQDQKEIRSDPLNLTYIISGQEVNLVDGKEEKEVAPGSASKISTLAWEENIVRGDVNNDGVDDSILFLVQDSGGSGSFFYIVVALKNPETMEYTGTEGFFLGDRVSPQEIVIENGEIIITYLDREENEPMAVEPTVEVIKFLVLDGIELKEALEN